MDSMQTATELTGIPTGAHEDDTAPATHLAQNSHTIKAAADLVEESTSEREAGVQRIQEALDAASPNQPTTLEADGEGSHARPQESEALEKLRARQMHLSSSPSTHVEGRESDTSGPGAQGAHARTYPIRYYPKTHYRIVWEELPATTITQGDGDGASSAEAQET